MTLIDDSFFADQPLRVPDDSAGFLLWRATHAWQRHVDQALTPTGLTHMRFALIIALAWLNRSGDMVTQRGLADFLGIHPMQISQVLGALEKAGLVVRRPSPSDGRALRVQLSEAGVEALKKAMPVVADAHRSFFDRPGVDLPALRGLLGALPA